MEQHLMKLVTQLSVIAIVAYVVASAVGKREMIQLAVKTEKPRGDRWQAPLALATYPDDALD